MAENKHLWPKGLWHHPLTLSICGRTGCTQAAAVGALYWFQCEYEPSSQVKTPLSMIDKVVGIQGFGAVMLELGVRELAASDKPKPAVTRKRQGVESARLAIAMLGGLVATGCLLKVSPQTISQWLNGKRRVPDRHCPTLEKLTCGQVACEDLRPDVNWSSLRGGNSNRGTD